MAARLRATSDAHPSRLTVDCLALGLCLLAVTATVTVTGCASDSGSAAARTASPSFLLSDQQKAERNLKNPASLHLAYGRFEEQVGQPGEARKSYEKALHENPQSVEAVLGLARLDQLGDKPKDAEAGFNHALRMKPNDPAVMAACGQFYASQKRWPEAFRNLNAAIVAAPHVAIYKHQLAVAETRSGDINAALAVFAQLVGPEKAHYNVAYLLEQEGRTDAAAQQCRVALALNPKFEPARVMLDQIQTRQVANNSRSGNRPAPAGTLRPATAPAGNGVAPIAMGSPTQSPSGATQASWQPGVAGSNGAGGAIRAGGSFDSALPNTSATNHAAPSADYSNDPWATVPAPPK